MAMMSVVVAKKYPKEGFIPLTYMWCAHTTKLRAPISPPISCCGTPELREGLKCLEYVSDAPQAAREPRCHAAQDVFRLRSRESGFSGGGMVEGIPLSGGVAEGERERPDQDPPGRAVRVSDLAVLEAEAA